MKNYPVVENAPAKKSRPYTPTFIDIKAPKTNWMKILFWINIGIIFALLYLTVSE